MSDTRQSPSGPLRFIHGTMTLASFVIATTAGATQTGTLNGVKANDVVNVSPRVNLNGAVGVAFMRVVSDNTIVVGFTNPGASTNQAAGTYDVSAGRATP